MSWNQQNFYKALQARDARFDGLFFVGVKSTGIFCRPVCPARTPLEKNCTFYLSRAEAASHGFRPCLRCRPERAPGQSPVDAVPRLAHVASSRLLEAESIAEVAKSLAVSDRQLRRAFRKVFGVSPSAYRNYQRLETARILLESSALSVADIAYASGFKSVRRFNFAFKEHSSLPPNRIRKGKTCEGLVLIPISFRPPLAWDEILDYLKTRIWGGVEAISGENYSRHVKLGEHQGVIRIRSKNKTTLELTLPTTLIIALPAVLRRIRNLFDLDSNPQEVFSHLQSRLSNFQLGQRVPGAFESFELALRAVLGQQVSVKAASTLAARFVHKFGTPLPRPQLGITHQFPTCRRLIGSSPEEIASIGLPTQRARTIHSLTMAFSDNPRLLQAGLDLEVQIAELLKLPGIGPWTAQYIAMRALRWPDAFPDGDLGLKKAMGLESTRLLEKSLEWRPWRSYAAMHLWKTL